MFQIHLNFNFLETSQGWRWRWKLECLDYFTSTSTLDPLKSISTTNKRVKKQMNTVFNHNINATISNKIQYSLRNTEVDQNETRYTKKFP